MLRRRRSEPPDPAGARDAALRSLGRREHSAAQLKAKLRLRGYTDETVEHAVGDLVERGWQSDARFAEMLVRSRATQGYGPLRIEAELRAAGVNDEGVRAAMEAFDGDWRSILAAHQERRFGGPPQGREAAVKQYRYFAGRGHRHEHIQSVLRGHIED